MSDDAESSFLADEFKEQLKEQISEEHSYLRQSATVHLTWFTFSCTINGTLLAKIVDAKEPVPSYQIIPWLLLVANMVAVMFLALSVWSFRRRRARMVRLHEKLRSASVDVGVPPVYWAYAAYCFAAIKFGLACAWLSLLLFGSSPNPEGAIVKSSVENRTDGNQRARRAKDTSNAVAMEERIPDERIRADEQPGTAAGQDVIRKVSILQVGDGDSEENKPIVFQHEIKLAKSATTPGGLSIAHVKLLTLLGILIFATAIFGIAAFLMAKTPLIFPRQHEEPLEPNAPTNAHSARQRIEDRHYDFRSYGKLLLYYFLCTVITSAVITLVLHSEWTLGRLARNP